FFRILNGRRGLNTRREEERKRGRQNEGDGVAHEIQYTLDRYTIVVRRAILWAILVVAMLAPAFAQTIPAAEYRQRRAELRKLLDGVMVLTGAVDPEDLH